MLLIKTCFSFSVFQWEDKEEVSNVQVLAEWGGTGLESQYLKALAKAEASQVQGQTELHNQILPQMTKGPGDTAQWSSPCPA